MLNKEFIHVKNLDKKTLNQFKSCSKLDFVISSSLMPDAHSGYVVPIGSVFLTKDYLVPSWIGYDIGCGVLTAKLNKKIELELIKKNSKKILNEVISLIPMGKSKLNHIQNISKKNRENFKKLLNNLEKLEKNNYFDLYKKIKNNGLSNLGSLGSGNHFIELGINSNKEIWCTIHTGSRNIGHLIAEKFMKIAEEKNNINLNSNNNPNRNNDKNNYKDNNNNNNSNNNNNNFEDSFKLNINSSEAKSYINFHNFAVDFATLNRIEILEKIEKILKLIFEDKKLELNIWANKPHNYLEKLNYNEFIHRKGATSSYKGEKGIIPANIIDGTYLVIGKGNRKFLFSSSHGAGRKLSRNEAKKILNLDEIKNEIKDIENNLDSTDEAPKAYKDINEILEMEKEAIEIVDHIIPIINWKG